MLVDVIVDIMDEIKKADREQIDSVLYYLGLLGFYREDKRVRKKEIYAILSFMYQERVNGKPCYDNDFEIIEYIKRGLGYSEII